MFIRLEELQDSRFDVCIIGAGPVGLALGISLSAVGVRTVLIETGGERPGTKDQDLSSLSSYNSDRHHSSNSTVVRALGGSSLRWGGRCVEFDDIDFEKREHVSDASWPMNHAALRPFYDRAREILSANAPAPPSEQVMDREFSLSRESWARVRNTAKANTGLLRADRFLQIVLHATATRMDVDVETGKIKSLSVNGRRGQRLIEAPYFVLAAGGRENTRLLLETQRRVPRLFGGPDGPLGRYYMGHLTGEIAAVTFRSHSHASHFLLNTASTGTVTRNRFLPSAAMQQDGKLLNVALWPDSLRPDEVIAGDGALSLFHVARHWLRRSGDPTFDNTISAREMSGAHFRNIASHPVQTIRGASRLIAARFLTLSRQPQNSFVSPTNTYLLRYHAEHAPSALSRVTLSDMRDANGNLRLNVDFRYTAQDFRSVYQAHLLLAAWLQTRGLGSLTYMKPETELEEWVSGQAVDGYHQIGLTRMSHTRNTGVVDQDCCVHDCRNLFIAGSSVFPTSSQANPTLPAVAMAVKLAAHLATLCQGIERR